MLNLIRKSAVRGSLTTIAGVFLVVQANFLELDAFTNEVIANSQRAISKSTTNRQDDPAQLRRDSSNANIQSPRVESRNDDGNYGEQGDTRVPFWNIAHMINSVDEIEPALREGSNGIETDISFDKQGNPEETYHGFPCDCGRHCHQREGFVKFVQHVAKMTVPPAASALQLVVLDLKLKDLSAEQKDVAGKGLAMVLDQHLYKWHQQALSGRRRGGGSQLQQPPVRVVVSINHIQDKVLVQSFIRYMRQNRLDFMSQMVGFDVGMNDNLTEISSMWDEFEGATYNIWQGDGLTNCANIIRGSDRLKEAVSIRNGQGHFRKIYYWTADVMYHIRSVLRLGLDAILTNQPQRVVQVLQEPEFRSKYRLATPYDDPFAQFWIKPSAWRLPIPSLSEAKETIDNIQKTSANFVKTLPDGIVAAIKKVHRTIVAPPS